MSYEEVIDLVGMTGWRLSDKVCPEVEELTTQVGVAG